MNLFKKNKKQFGLHQLEATVGSIKAAGVDPDRKVLVAVVSTVKVLGVEVTAHEHGKADIAHNRAQAKAHADRVPQVLAHRDREVSLLQDRIRATVEVANISVKHHEDSAESHEARAAHVTGLLELLP